MLSFQLGPRFLTSPPHPYSLLWAWGPFIHLYKDTRALSLEGHKADHYLYVVLKDKKKGAVPLFLPIQEIDDLLAGAFMPDGEEAVEGELERIMRRNLLQVN
jgi:hypothetical protein